MPHPFLGLGFNSWSQKFSRGSAAVAALLEYVTTSVSSFTLLSTGTVDYEVDWGDGTTESLTTNNPTHTYSSAGEYTIKVTPAEGSTYRPYFNNAVTA
jgi:PKD repeat protein